MHCHEKSFAAVLLLVTCSVEAKVGLERGQYNCFTREMWTAEKAEWCCQVRGIGCKPDSCALIKERHACNGMGCSWCEAGSAQVAASFCKTLAEAKLLPPSVLVCDHV